MPTILAYNFWVVEDTTSHITPGDSQEVGGELPGNQSCSQSEGSTRGESAKEIGMENLAQVEYEDEYGHIKGMPDEYGHCSAIPGTPMYFKKKGFPSTTTPPLRSFFTRLLKRLGDHLNWVLGVNVIRCSEDNDHLRPSAHNNPESLLAKDFRNRCTLPSDKLTDKMSPPIVRYEIMEDVIGPAKYDMFQSPFCLNERQRPRRSKPSPTPVQGLPRFYTPLRSGLLLFYLFSVQLYAGI